MPHEFKRVVLYVLCFLVVLISVNATVQSVVISLNGENYDYAIISREYDLFVAGTNLETIENSELTLVSNNGEVAQYKFLPGNIAGERNFGEFSINVLSEADDLANSIDSIKIEVNDKNSTIEINGLDISDKIIRNFNFDLDEFHGLIDLSNLLGGITFDLNFVKDETHPKYNQLYIDPDSSASNVIGGILAYNSLNDITVNKINTDPSLLNQVIDKYNANVEYITNARAIKQGNDFSFYTDEGYANLEGSDLENLQSIINEKIKFINPDQVVETLLPIGDFSEFKQFVDFDISVDFGDLKLEDGTYSLKILYEDKFGNTGEKEFKVILDITNVAQPETPVDGKIEFKDPIINQTLEKIEGLPSDVNLTAVIFGNVKPPEFPSTTTEVKTALKFMQINLSRENIVGSFDLSFSLDKSLINADDKNNIILYIEENNAWTSLTTTFINETTTKYKHKATIPHFSNFMIAVHQVSTSTGGGVTEGNGPGNDETGDNEPIILPPTPAPPAPQSQEEEAQSLLPTQPFIQEPAPEGFLAITARAITDLINKNPLAAVFFGLVALLGTLVVYTLLFYKKPRKEKKPKKEKKEDIEKQLEEVEEK